VSSYREAVGRALVDLGERYENLIVLDADVSRSTRACYFAERFPDRFINVGISEQDMVGVAAGLASSGKIAVVTGFAMFTVGRAWEQIRNVVARGGLNVKVVVTHGGLSNHTDGASHQIIEDIAMMRVIPGMTVVVPADYVETYKALEALVESHGPAYMRVGRDEAPDVYGWDLEYRLGRANVVRDGSDAVIYACGVMVSQAVEASDVLRGDGLDVAVVDVHTVKPLDRGLVVEYARRTGAVVTAEEHSVYGGLGGAVAEALSETYPVPIIRVGVMDMFGASSRDYWRLMERYGLTVDRLIAAVKRVVDMR